MMKQPVHKRTHKHHRKHTVHAEQSSDKNLADNTQLAHEMDLEQRREEFLKAVNSKLKKSEKETWMNHDLDHLFENRK